MRQNTKTNNLIRNIVIFSDFIALNLLFYAFLQFERTYLHLNTGSFGNWLALMQNFGMVIAQYYFSTIIHQRIVGSEQVLRQTTYLSFTQILSASILTKIFFSIENFTTPNIEFYVYFGGLLYIALIIIRFTERYCIKRYRSIGKNSRTVIFIGSDKSLIGLYDSLVSDPSTGYRVIGYYANELMEDAPGGLKHLGDLNDLNNVIENTDVLKVDSMDEVYCSLSWSKHDEVNRIMKYCDKNVIHFYYIPIYAESFGHSLKIESIGNTITFTNYETPLSLPANRLVKRTFDLVISCISLLCLLPIIPIIALIIKIQSPGPIFFKQARTGMNGKEFQCYKFRSMHVNKDADLVQATEHDPRKFSFGNFMRKANIDELPQFWNVFIGNMSIVGPRPHMLHHTETYAQLIDKYMVRHFVKPGVTGWAQVTGFRGETKELWQMEGRVKRDIWYIENWSIWLDLRIIWRTAKQLIIPDQKAY